MTSSKNPFGFTTPKRKKFKNGINIIDLANLEVWIQNLPMGNAGHAAYLLNLDIKSKNRMLLDYHDRLEYLELIRDPLFHIVGIMENYFVGVNFPLTQKQQNIASACREFHYLMTLGYIITIEELFEQSKKPKSNKDLGLLLHRAITYLSRVLLISYQVYAPVSKTIWEKMNKLFLFAEENKIDKIQILDNQHQCIHKTTVLGEYTRVIYLTLAKPYHLRSGEVSNIYINLERWLELIKPRIIKNEKKAVSDFAINLQQDTPPHFINFGTEKISPKQFRIFGTKDLINEIDLELERSELITSNTLITANLGDANLGHDLLRRLKHSWIAEPDDKIKSTKVRKQVELVIGISAISETLKKLCISRQKNKESQASLQKNFNLYFDEITDCDATDIEYIKIDSTTNSASAENDSSQVDVNDIFQKKVPAKAAYWELIKQSSEEFYLHCKTDSLQQIQVGEIIGLRKICNKENDVNIAIITWLKTNGDNGIIFGAKRLSPSAIAIQIEMLAKSSNKQMPQPALLLPANSHDSQVSSVITYPSPFRSGCLVAINVNKKNIPLKLIAGLDNSGLYNRFQYERLTTGQPKKHEAKPIKKTKEKIKSGNVWNSF